MEFSKVSFNEFVKSYEMVINDDDDESMVKAIYDSIELPKRATKGSAGYDFSAPFGFNLNKGDNIVIPTGIRIMNMPSHSALFLFPRSGHGFKFRFAMANSVGIIDSDYMYADNEGHIMVKLCYDGINGSNILHKIEKKPEGIYIQTMSRGNDYKSSPNMVTVKYHEKFCQGIIIPCLRTDDDNTTRYRKGGLGSTDDPER